LGISSGKALGEVHFFGFDSPKKTVEKIQSLENEEARLKKALNEVLLETERLIKVTVSQIGKAEAEIFEIHAMLLEDGDFLDALSRELSHGKSAEDAVSSATESYAAELAALPDPYLQARASDLRDIGARLTEALSEKPTTGKTPDRPYILIARDLTPSQTVQLDKGLILGFVTFGGSANSHTAILARAMGIPAVVNVGEISPEREGEIALLDAENGTLSLSPTAEEQAQFERRLKEENKIAKEHERYLRTLMSKPAVTRSGHRMRIYANVGDTDEVLAAMQGGADGIGLFRSEMLYLSLNRYPTEEELFSYYQKAVHATEGRRIIIRTLDIGADKTVPYFSLPHEENPALGFRAVRICLSRRDVFKVQLRAILRASAHGSVSVMIPMIVSPEEVLECKRILEDCKRELREEKIPMDEEIEFGIMVETPAAAIMSREIAPHVDFFSVGTNDLTQYTLAADRQNPQLAEICDSNTEPVLRLIGQAADAIHQCGGWIGICGEMAADLHLTQRFADMRIDELSVSVPYLLGLREKVIDCK
jgi:phosphotransferase system enzyme I (PtsI)